MPRYKPSIAQVKPPQEPPAQVPPDVQLSERERSLVHAANATAAVTSDPYTLQHERLHIWDGDGHREAVLPPGAVVPSYFHDLLLEAESEQRAIASMNNWPLRGDTGDPDAPHVDADLAQARERLQRTREFALLRRDITGGSGGFLPAAGPPGYVADAFATAARSGAPLAEALERRAHPGSLKISTPRIVSGAAVSVQSGENQSVAEVDRTSALVETPTASIAGQLDVSRQLFDFSNPGSDEWVSAELGAASTRSSRSARTAPI